MWRYAILVCLAATVLLAATFALARKDQQSGPHIQGIWVTRISDHQELEPCGDGEHVWAWAREELYVVDRFAKSKAVLSGKGSIYEVRPAGPVGEGNKRQAWVVAGMPKKLFRVETDGKVEPYSLDQGKLDRVTPSGAKTDFGWASMSEPSGLYRVAKGQPILYCQLPADLDISEVLPTGDRGEQAWVKGKTGFFHVGADGTPTPYPQWTNVAILGKTPSAAGVRYLWVGTEQGGRSRLNRLGADKSTKVYGALDGIPITKILPLRIPDGSAWAITKDGRRIYFVDERCIQGPAPKPVVPGVGEPERTYEVRSVEGNEGLVWLWPPDSDGMLLLRPNQEPTRPIEDEKILAFEVSPAGNKAWAVVVGGDIYCLRADSREKPRPVTGLEDLGVEKLFPAPDERHAWVLSRFGRLHLLDQKTKVRSFDLINRVSTLFVNAEDKDHVWAAHEEGDRLSFLGMEKELTSRPGLDSKGGHTRVFPAADGKHGWITTDKGNYCWTFGLNQTKTGSKHHEKEKGRFRSGLLERRSNPRRPRLTSRATRNGRSPHGTRAVTVPTNSVSP